MTISLYSIINIFAILISSLILIRRIVNLDKRYASKIFDYLIISQIIISAFETLWGFYLDKLIVNNHLNGYILNAGYFLFLGIVPCLWFFYSEKIQESQFLKNKLYIAIAIFPLVVYSILVWISYFANSIFYIDDAGVLHRGNLYFISYVLFYGYLLFTSIKAIVLSSRKENYAKRDRYYSLVSFLIFPIIFGILQITIEGIPFLPIGISLAILSAYTDSQDQLISLDYLTQINNRAEMINFLSNKIKEKKNHISLYLLDIDNFKRINDLYGHLEGDNVLIRVAKSLKIFAAKHNAFISRYAGDEFIVIIDNKEVMSVNEFYEEINHIIFLENEACNAPYNVHISVGMKVYDHEVDSIPTLIEGADKELYKNKSLNK